MQIHVHAGVHKTASTYLQTILEKNRPALNECGIGYAPLDILRKSFTAKLHTLCGEQFRIENHLNLFFADRAPGDVNGLIISDENLLGLTSTFLKSGHLYAEGPDNLRHIRHLLKSHDIRLFISVRSYDEFLASIYSEGLRWSSEAFSFADFRERLDMSSVRWPSLVKRLTEALRPSEVLIWRYEDFRSAEQTVASKIAFDFANSFDFHVAKDLKSAMSHTAVQRIEAMIRQFGGKAAAKLVRLVDAQFPKEAGFPPFSPWSEDERRHLREMYEADLRHLPDSWLVSPPGPVR